jgi:hypothetical protein
MRNHPIPSTGQQTLSRFPKVGVNNEVEHFHFVLHTLLNVKEPRNHAYCLKEICIGRNAKLNLVEYKVLLNISPIRDATSEFISLTDLIITSAGCYDLGRLP